MKNRGFLAVMMLAVVSSVFASTALAQVRISQVFGGGGVSGSALRRDFVELRNTGAVPVPIGGWSIQFAHTTLSTWQVTALPAVSISPGEFFLVAFSAGGGGTVDLPTPDATGTTNLPPVGGKVALVRSIAPLSGSGCPIDYGVVEDFVGYGAADCREGGTTAPPGGAGDGFGSAEWLFNVAGSSEFFVSIDFAALGLFDGVGPGGVPDRFVFRYQLDGQPATPAPLFVVEPMDPARPYFCVMARGTKARYELGPDLRGPLAANGIELRNVPTRVMARLNACGPESTLRLILEASTDGERKVFAFDNIRVLGGTCAPPAGSCCNGAQCAVTLEAQCGGVFRLGDTCDVATTLCCPADFNRSGTLTVQDLFDFFAAYFGGSPSGDFNRSGMVTVQDIFDFLAAYFAGCP